ncbi:CoA transferase [Microbacterium sp. RD1]|uniref:CoA transferase n=1 Tax=Microbacterium sp. RD1 TaxID=3457313 RepID=UPI003FA613BB
MATASGPLDGVRVVDLSSFVAGPSATLTLAHLGADVVRVDPEAGPVDGARYPIGPDGASLYWTGLNRGKRVARADLRSDAGRGLVHELLRASGPGGGIVVTNAVGQEWLSYDSLAAVRPDLILVRIEGRADGGSAVDYTIQPETGLPDITGPAILQSPVGSLLPAWDLLAGQQAAVAVLAALRRRDATGTGGEIRISLADVAAATLAHLGYVADAVVNSTVRTRDGNALYGSYSQDFALADGCRVMVTALTRRHWANLVTATGTAEPLAALERHTGSDFSAEAGRWSQRSAITGILEPWFASRPRAEVAAVLDAALVPWGLYRSIGEMAGHPDGLVARSPVFDVVTHDGVGTYPVPRTVARAEGWGATPTPAPRATTPAAVAAEWRTA